MMSFFIFILLAYLIGSIATSVWVSRYFYGVEIREKGSKNAGATNVLRVLGKKPALFVFVFDVLKGFLPVFCFPFYVQITSNTENYVLFQLALAFMVVLGHIFPVFAQFRGGKGVATLLGVSIALVPKISLICFVFFVVVLFLSRMVSLSSLLTCLFFSCYVFFIEENTLYSIRFFAIFATLLLFITHRKNIQRIYQGNENKIKF